MELWCAIEFVPLHTPQTIVTPSSTDSVVLRIGVPTRVPSRATAKMDDTDVFGDISRMHQKQVTIHAGDEGLAETGRVLYVEPDWTTDDLLQAAGRRLDLVSTPKRMFNCNGELIVTATCCGRRYDRMITNAWCPTKAASLAVRASSARTTGIRYFCISLLSHV